MYSKVEPNSLGGLKFFREFKIWIIHKNYRIILFKNKEAAT